MASFTNYAPILAIIFSAVIISSFILFNPSDLLAGEFSAKPLCKFDIPVGQTTLFTDLVIFPQISCDSSCIPQRIVSGLVDGKPFSPKELSFLSSFAAAENTWIVLPSHALLPGGWTEGRHSLLLSLTCTNGQRAAATTSFTALRSIDENIKENVISAEGYSASYEPIDTEQLSFEPEKDQSTISLAEGGGGDVSSPDCKIYADPLYPYFYSRDGGYNTVLKKQDDYWKYISGAEKIYSDNFHSSLHWLRIETVNGERSDEQTGSSKGWNDNGFGMIVNPDGSYFGIGITGDHSDALVDFADYMSRAKKNYPNSVLIIAIDEFLSSGGNSVLKGSSYIPQFGVLILDMTTQDKIEDFIYKGKNYNEYLPDKIVPFYIAHELGHSMHLGHYSAVITNLMYPTEGPNHVVLTSSQTCDIRRMCHHSELMGEPYGIFTESGEQYTCNNGLMEAKDLNTIETCENNVGTDGLDQHWHIDCSKDDPGLFADLSQDGKYQWGSHTTPYWCYKQNPAPGSGESGKCDVDNFCGNGVFEPDKGEECEKGAYSNNCKDPLSCDLNPDGTGSCLCVDKRVCGDKNVDKEIGEECDPPGSPCLGWNDVYTCNDLCRCPQDKRHDKSDQNPLGDYTPESCKCPGPVAGRNDCDDGWDTQSACKKATCQIEAGGVIKTVQCDFT